MTEMLEWSWGRKYGVNWSQTSGRMRSSSGASADLARRLPTKDIDQLFLDSQKSPFRRRLRSRCLEYLESKDLNGILTDAAELVAK
jgi:hypothetical protein